MISRAKLRGKPIDSDCMRAHRTTHEYGVKDDRVYCYGLYEDMSDWKIREKCKELKIKFLKSTFPQIFTKKISMKILTRL